MRTSCDFGFDIYIQEKTVVIGEKSPRVTLHANQVQAATTHSPFFRQDLSKRWRKAHDGIFNINEDELPLFSLEEQRRCPVKNISTVQYGTVLQ